MNLPAPIVQVHGISEWDKPLTYQMVSDYGYDPCPALATLPQNISKYAACFKKLVPILQQCIVDCAANPGPTDARYPLWVPNSAASLDQLTEPSAPM